MKNLALTALGLLMCTQTLHVRASALAETGRFEVIEEDLVFARAGDIELQAHSYRPQTAGVAPAVIDIHGGAWSVGDRMGGQTYARALASSGLYVFSIDFRQAPDFQHPAASRDIVAAIHYLRANATRLKIDTETLGLIGSSSGGHLAMLTGLKPNAADFAGTFTALGSGRFGKPEQEIKPLDYIIALWPVSDPAYRYEFAKRTARQDLIKSHDAYFGSPQQMLAASVPRAIRDGEAESLPALLVVQPGKDGNIPREMTLDLIDAYQSAGGALEYLFVPGQPHAFGHRPSAATNELVRAMRDFIARRLTRE